jgi:hypothetical protein
VVSYSLYGCRFLSKCSADSEGRRVGQLTGRVLVGCRRTLFLDVCCMISVGVRAKVSGVRCDEMFRGSELRVNVNVVVMCPNEL